MTTKKSSSCLPIGCGILIAAPLLVVALAKLVDTPAAKAERDREYEAKAMSEKLVLAALKYPLDAEMGNTKGGAASPNNWRFSGTVKAKNGFGGMHTLTWYSEVVWNKTGYHVNALRVGDDTILPAKAKKK